MFSEILQWCDFVWDRGFLWLSGEILGKFAMGLMLTRYFLNPNTALFQSCFYINEEILSIKLAIVPHILIKSEA